MQVRLASRNAYQCSDHLAIHSSRNRASYLFDIGQELDSLADKIRYIIDSLE
jgi:hypothetical protein